MLPAKTSAKAAAEQTSIAVKRCLRPFIDSFKLSCGFRCSPSKPKPALRSSSFFNFFEIPRVQSHQFNIAGPAGASNDAIAANLDLLPTFVKLAGGKLPTDHRIDGEDLSPLLLGRTQKSPHDAHYYFSGNALEAVRSGPWKLAIAR